MCLPAIAAGISSMSAATLTALKIGSVVASTAGSYMTQLGAAQRQNELYMKNAQIANNDATEKYAQNHLQLIQTEAKATQERMNNQINMLNARGKVQASSINGGNSVALSSRDIERQGANNSSVINRNVQNAQVQAGANDRATYTENQNIINSVGTSSGPSLLATALTGLGGIAGVLGTGLSAANSRYDAGIANTTGTANTTTDINLWDKSSRS